MANLSFQRRFGAVMTMVTVFGNLIAGFVVTPLMLRIMGQSQFAMYSLTGFILGYLLILDLGFSNTITRWVAKYRSANQLEPQENMLAICILIYCCISAMIVLLGAGIYCLLPVLFAKGLTSDEISLTRTMFVILVANLAVSLPMNSYGAAISGYERFVFLKLVSVIKVPLRALIVICFLLVGYKALAVVIIDTALNFALLVTIFYYAHFVLKIRARLHRFDIGLVRELFQYSVKIFVASIINEIYWRIGPFLLGMYVNSAAVAVYSIAMTFVNLFMQLSIALTSVILPKLTAMHETEAGADAFMSVMIKIGRLQFYLLALILIAFIFVGRQFLSLWAGHGYEQSWNIALIFSALLFVPHIQTTFTVYLQACNRLTARTAILLLSALFNLVINYFFVRAIGLNGITYGTATALLLGNILVLNGYYWLIGLDIKRFFKQAFLKLLPSALLAAAVIAGLMLVLNYCSSDHGWLMLFVRGAIVAIVFMVSSYWLGTDDYEKGFVKRLLVKISNFNKV